MRRFRKTPVVALAVSLAVFLPGVGGPGERVVCIGADGHIAIEAAVSPGACFSASLRGDTSSHDPERELSREGDHCGPCVDVPPLSGPWANTSFSSHLSGPAVWFSMSLLPTSLQGDEMPASAGEGLLAVRFRTPADAPGAFLRTTVLLI